MPAAEEPRAAEAPPVPFERSYWVAPGRFLAGAYPGNRDAGTARAKLGLLLDAGIRTIVDLTGEAETNWAGEPFVGYAEAFVEAARERGVPGRCLRFPVPDVSVPSREGMVSILDAIDASLAEGLPVYVHCWGGIGRTGTVVGCWLVRHGVPPGDEALERIALLRRDDPLGWRFSPESEEQRRLVTSWSEP